MNVQEPFGKPRGAAFMQVRHLALPPPAAAATLWAALQKGAPFAARLDPAPTATARDIATRAGML